MPCFPHLYDGILRACRGLGLGTWSLRKCLPNWSRSLKLCSCPSHVHWAGQTREAGCFLGQSLWDRVLGMGMGSVGASSSLPLIWIDHPLWPLVSAGPTPAKSEVPKGPHETVAGHLNDLEWLRRQCSLVGRSSRCEAGLLASSPVLWLSRSETWAS